MTNIGDKLRELRERHGVTQRQLADALGVSHTYISKIENGHTQPSYGFLKNADRALGTNEFGRPVGATPTYNSSMIEVRIGFFTGGLDHAEARKLRDDLDVALGDDAQPCNVCETAPVYSGPLCAGCLAAREGR